MKSENDVLAIIEVLIEHPSTLSTSSGKIHQRKKRKKTIKRRKRKKKREGKWEREIKKRIKGSDRHKSNPPPLLSM